MGETKVYLYKKICLCSVKQVELALSQKFDIKFEGFGSAPKFPQPQNLLYLLTYNAFYDNSHALGYR